MVSKTSIFLAIAQLIAAASACSGGFAQSCSNIGLVNNGDGHFLNALCSDGHGGTHQNSYLLGDCVGDNNGHLVCGDGGMFGEKCSNVQLHGTVLSASCLDLSGNPIATSIDLNSIIGNFGGVIHC